jgi:hypothetical protein
MRFAPTGILLIMETIPTLGCICYSVGMIAAERGGHKNVLMDGSRTQVVLCGAKWSVI